jgi:hypothetical protein
MRWLVYVNREIFRQVDTQVLLFFFFFLWLQNNVICIEFVLNHLLVRNVFGSKLLVAYIL